MSGTAADKTFGKYLEEAIGQENARIAFSAFGMLPSVSIRMNPFKRHAGEGPVGETVPWNRFGVMLDTRPNFTLDPVFHAGGYYVQDSSSMFTGHIFRRIAEKYIHQDRPVRVLDLCAAPGGKTRINSPVRPPRTLHCSRRCGQTESPAAASL